MKLASLISMLAVAAAVPTDPLEPRETVEVVIHESDRTANEAPVSPAGEDSAHTFLGCKAGLYHCGHTLYHRGAGEHSFPPSPSILLSQGTRGYASRILAVLMCVLGPYWDEIMGQCRVAMPSFTQDQCLNSIYWCTWDYKIPWINSCPNSCRDNGYDRNDACK